MTTPANDIDDSASASMLLDFDTHAAGFSKALAHLDHAAVGESDEWLAALAVWVRSSEEELAALVGLISVINAWNAIGVSTARGVPAPTSPDTPEQDRSVCR